jgi:hypothetical protein
MFLYAGDSKRKKDALGALTRPPSCDRRRSSPQAGSAARSRDSISALNYNSLCLCTRNRHHRETAKLPIAGSVKRGNLKPEPLRRRVLLFGRGFGGIPRRMKAEVLSVQIMAKHVR